MIRLQTLARPGAAFALLFSIAAFACQAGAQVADLVQKPVDAASRVKLSGSIHPLVKKSTDGGSVSASLPMQRMVLLLNRSDKQEKALTSLLSSMQDKSSSNYHQWLTPEQFAAQFGVSDNDVAAVTGWLKQQGFTVDSVGRGKQYIQFSGTANQVETALGTQIHTLTYNNEKHIANVSAISVPEALAPAVRGVLSLNDFHKRANIIPRANLKFNSAGKWEKAAAGQATTASGKLKANFSEDTGPDDYGVLNMLAPGDLSTIYNTKPLVANGTNGSGVTIAIVGRSDIEMSDIESYRSIFQLPANDPNIIVNGPDPGDISGDDLESTLDLEISGALAPNATIDFVESASTNTSDGVDLSAIYIVDNVLAPIMSTSYGLCEADLGTAGNAFYNSLWQQAAAEGITSLVSAGDTGGSSCDGENIEGAVLAYGPAVSGLASTPYNVAVGGTMFNESAGAGPYWNTVNGANLGSAIGYIPEMVWNESCDATLVWCAATDGATSLYAGGGGASSCVVEDANGNCINGYPKPAWQTGIGVPSDGVRDVPDVSLAAAGYHDPYIMCYQGSCTTDTLNGQVYLTGFTPEGGTSASSPAFAGILSLIEQKTSTYQGQINTTLYQLFSASTPSSCNSTQMTLTSSTTSCVFNDITTGNNVIPDESGEYAGTGYDLASGIGSVNAANLLSAWPTAAKLATATTASLSSTTFTHGQSVNAVLQVAPTVGTGVPSGDVALVTDKYGSVSVATLSGGQVIAPLTTLPGGTYNLTAKYGGDSNYASSTSSPIALTVKPEDAVLTISSYTQTWNLTNGYSNPITTTTTTYGNELNFTVTAAGKSGQGTPTGSISIYDNGVLIGTASLTSENYVTIATGYPPSLLAVPSSKPIYLSTGSHSITATYTGDNSFNAVTTTPAYVATITKASPILMDTRSSPLSAAVGTPLTMTGTPEYAWTGAGAVSPADPTGSIQFSVNGTNYGDPQSISENQVDQGSGIAVPNVPSANLSYTFTSSLSGLISATYSGDANYLPFTGGNRDLTIYSTSQKLPKITLTASPAHPTVGQLVNYTVTALPDKNGDATPTGTVTVLGAAVNYYTSLYYTATLVNGVATFQSVAIQAGDSVSYATYSGDSVYTGAASSAITVPVKQAVPTVTLTTSSTYAAPNSQTIFYASVSADSAGYIVSGPLTSAIQFYDAVNGAAAQPLGAPHYLLNNAYTLPANLPAGTNVITVQYPGDTDWMAATSAPVTVTVTNPDYQVTSSATTVDISSGGTSTATITITPILGFSQPVTLSCGTGLPVGVTCSFSPATVTPNGGPVTTTLTLTSAGAYTSASNTKFILGGSGMSLAALACLILPGRRRRSNWLLLLLVALGTGSMIGCGGSSTPKTVTAAAPTLSSVSLSTSAVKVASGQPVTLTAAITVDGTSPTGTVTFLEGSTTLGSSTVTDGAATLTTSTLQMGTHTITASYSGDTQYEVATSSAIYEAITGSMSLSVSAASGTDTHALPLTVTLQ